MTKLLAGKLIVLGMAASVLIFVTGILVGFSQAGFTFRPLLLAFVSFTLSAAVILWFGKRNLKRGIVCGMVWSAGTACLALWETSSEFIVKMNIGIVLLVFVLGLGAAVLTVYQFIKDISYEGVCETWNYSLTA
jgi:hypothetical protein